MSLFDPSPFQRFLARLTARSPLAEAERQAILALPGTIEQVHTNRDFVRLGEHVDHACLIVDGLVGRFGQNREGARQITAVHIPGEMADLHSVVMPQASSALQALAVSTIVKVPHRALRDVAARFPAVAEAFWRECVVDAAVLAEWIVNVGRRNSQTRMAHLLCEMAWRYEAVGTRTSFSFGFPATQNHLADMLGLTPVHVNRTLMALKGEGLVALRGRVAEILDWPALADLGEFDPEYLQIRPAANDDRPVAAA